MKESSKTTIRKVTVFLSVCGAGLVLLAETSQSQLALGITFLFASVLVYFPGAKNRHYSISVGVFAAVTAVIFYLAFSYSPFAIFHVGYLISTVIVLPIIFMLLGSLLTPGAFVHRLKNDIAYYFSIASISLINLAVVGIASLGV